MIEKIALTIPANIMHGMLTLAPKNDVRDHLNGVFVDITESEVRLVATNGRWMGIYRMRDVITGAPASGLFSHDMKRKSFPAGEKAYSLWIESDGIIRATTINHPVLPTVSGQLPSL